MPGKDWRCMCAALCYHSITSGAELRLFGISMKNPGIYDISKLQKSKYAQVPTISESAGVAETFHRRKEAIVKNNTKCMQISINSLRPSNAYMQQETKP